MGARACVSCACGRRTGDLAAVYRLASPRSQLLSGSFAKFRDMMRNSVYRPLVGHADVSREPFLPRASAAPPALGAQALYAAGRSAAWRERDGGRVGAVLPGREHRE